MNGGKPDLSSGQHSNSPLSSQANSGESKAASVTSTETGARSKLPVLTVTIRHSSGSYNRYEWDETRQQLCLAERVRFDRHNFFETGTVPGTLTPRGVELTVLLPADLPVFPGALVKARPIGLLKLNSQSQLTQARRDILHQEFIIAVPLADSLYVNTRTLTDLPPSWKWEVEQGLMSQLPKVETFTDLGLSQNKANNAKGQGLNWQWEEAEEAYKVVARCRQAFRSAQTNPTRPNWQISDEELDDFLRGDLFKEDETARHTDAENQFFRLPHRFQQHVARCLLPHERIIAWIFRPAFKEGVLWRKMQHQDAILIQTDRQLLWLTDTLPPGSTLVDWGYRVEAFSLHKLRQVELVGIEARTDLSPLQGSTSVSSSLLLY